MNSKLAGIGLPRPFAGAAPLDPDDFPPREALPLFSVAFGLVVEEEVSDFSEFDGSWADVFDDDLLDGFSDWSANALSMR